MSDKRKRTIHRQNGEILEQMVRIEELEGALSRCITLVRDTYNDLMTDLHTCALADDLVWAFDQTSRKAFEEFEESTEPSPTDICKDLPVNENLPLEDLEDEIIYGIPRLPGHTDGDTRPIEEIMGVQNPS